MDLGLKGKNALVGGGSRGIGGAIAKGLAAEGANVILVARDQARLEGAQKEIESLKQGRVHTISYDLSQVGGIPQLVEKAAAVFGSLDILINNTGGPKPGTVLDVSNEDWDRTLDQNLKSVIYMTRAALPHMRKQKFGRILTIASQYVKEPFSGMILSNTSRAGVVGFLKSIAAEFAEFNITVNTLCPGPIMSDRMQYLIQKRSEAENISVESIRDQIRQNVPMKRIGSPEEMAHVAVFLASERASFVTGTTLSVDGGITKGLI